MVIGNPGRGIKYSLSPHSALEKESVAEEASRILHHYHLCKPSGECLLCLGGSISSHRPHALTVDNDFFVAGDTRWSSDVLSQPSGRLGDIPSMPP